MNKLIKLGYNVEEIAQQIGVCSSTVRKYIVAQRPDKGVEMTAAMKRWAKEWDEVRFKLLGKEI